MTGKLTNPYIYSYYDKNMSKIIYIGKTNGRDKSYRTGSKVLKRYISMFGYDTFDNRFDRNVLEHCSKENISKREEYYIEKYDTTNEGVNLTRGGRYDFKRFNFKPIVQYDLEGNFIREWNSGIEAYENTNLTNYGGISACCKGKQPTSGGFIWRYKSIPVHCKINPYQRKSYKKRIGGGGAIEITIEGKTYVSKEECMRVLKIPHSKLKKMLENESKS